MKSRITELAQHYHSRLCTIRHIIHQNPELSGEEKETAKLICQVLTELSIPYQDHFSGNGVVAIIEGTLPTDTPHKVVALRADMDALPIQEENEIYYHSKKENIMHACGHDFHTTSLLGALMVIHDLKHTFSGSIKFIFQPSEEEYSGGAKYMIQDGVLKYPTADYIFGIHADPAYQSGQFAFHEGTFMASTDELHFHLIGKGGHAALVNELSNPVIAGANMITRMMIEAEKLKPCDTPFVLNFGKFIATGSNNIVPDKAEISGTLRMFDEDKREEILKMLSKVSVEECAKFGVFCQPDIRHGYPNLVNDIGATRIAKQLATEYVGSTNVIDAPLRSTAEDFSYYLQQIPGSFIRVGITKPQSEVVHKLHTSRFDVDDSALIPTVGYLAYLATSILINKL